MSRGEKRRAQIRRRRLVLSLIVVLAGVVIAIVISSGPAPPPAAKSSSSTNNAIVTGVAAIKAVTLPWQLTSPLSREVVLPGASSNELLIAGGLGSSGSSDSGIYALDTADGRLTPRGSLTTPTHDAAGAIEHKDALVFGGGTTGPSATTQRFTLSGTALSSGLLPQARADAAATTIGNTAYIVGGYNGPALDPEVLATTDGLHFKSVAALPVPVRYPAVAALDGKIYVFGGQTVNGQPVRTVQIINPSAHTASLTAEMPIAISGATAANVGGTIYLAGGQSGTGSSALRAIVDIFAFDPLRASFIRAGSLPVAVSNAGAAVLGKRLWILGGEVTGGTPSSAVQMLEPKPGRGLS